ncbi:MAG TPA: ABC transporter permease [Cyclobacteriaceae bacterium]|nr:ABC transporter permease [Cyclobacteriaceae bacterium]HMV88667.1 ABC transporter permease [Cyclobacteriaceae bacterium]HMX00571.1 ABC transporter permease [Cyclobacteriaceae bacterium]HMX49554.1 ABC transporter permease [Cyclobacteriaceae bacterium]HMY93374.1 ABC transporter permease [Cyclobacteriaceae bacterium]
MKHAPPKWADRFLAWYCRHDLLEEIQGDVYELYDRTAKQNKRKADFTFVWNVLRFFRWKNIHKKKSSYNNSLISSGMVKNIFKVAIRNFLSQPGHSFLSVFGLTVSFVAAFLIMLWVMHETSFDRYHDDSQRIFKVMSHVESNGSFETYDAASFGIDVSGIPEITKQAPVITGDRWPNVLCFRGDPKNDCIYITGIYSKPALFEMLNFTILRGEKNPIDREFTVAISEDMANRLFNSIDVIGKTLKIDLWYEATITAVFKDVPTNSSLQFDFVMPVGVFQKLRGFSDESLANSFFSALIKTGSDVNAEVLTAKLNTAPALTESLKRDKVSYQAFPFTDWRLKSKFENGKSVGGKIQYVTLFIIIAILVLAMAVINFVNLSTARATNRAKEIGIRKTTGALRSGIVFQFLSESLVIVFFAFVLAVIATQLLLPYFNSMIGETLSVQLFSGVIPVYLLAFLILVALAAGLYPALVMSSFQPARALKGELSTRASGVKYLRKVLLVVQLSVSIGIVIFSGVIFNQLDFIIHKDLGYDRENMVRLEPTYKLLKQYDAFKTELLKNHAIASVTATNGNPLSLQGHTTGVSWQGKSEDTRVTFQTLGGNYDLVETFGFKLLDGRVFDPKKDTLGNEVMITKEAARVMSMTNPIGEKITIGSSQCVIIGVLDDFHTESLRNEKLPVVIYRQSVLQCSAIYVKYQSESTQQAMEIVRATYKKMEPDFTLNYWFQDETFDNMYKTETTASYMVVIFTIISLVIAVIGVVGLATYNVIRKQKEIGIKRVFGATVTNILSMLTKEFVIIILVASVVAIPFVWYSADRWLSGFAYRINMPWMIYITTFAGTLLLIALIVGLQGFKAANSNPVKTLRSE